MATQTNRNDQNDLKEQFLQTKRALFDKAYAFLNREQREAVFSVDGPLLVLAGAGSGKTTVLVQRIAFLLRYGNAYFDESLPDLFTAKDLERLKSALDLDARDLPEVLSELAVSPVEPYRVVAITFTNKAANEIKSRLSSILGEEGEEIRAGTFHSVCMRILRRNPEQAGLRSGFTIYDTDDVKKLLTNCMKELNIDEKTLPVKTVMSEISRAKDRLCTVDEFDETAGQDFRLRLLCNVYRLYQQRLTESNAVDFDDIIMRTVLMLQRNPSVRSYYQNLFRYVSIDEYQDTNHAQFVLADLLAGGFGNLMVVGDDDQSIYKFRGATIDNILNFDKQWRDAKIVKLEQNYRSTQNILNAANSIIRHNFGRRSKALWSENGEGEKVQVCRVENQIEEARFIINKIAELKIREKRKYSDFAVLYRFNAFSSSLEDAFRRCNVPCRLIGAVRFVERKEVKDVLAYLNVIHNPDDNLRLKRIINEPKRKIGESTVAAVEDLAEINGVSMFNILENAFDHPALAKSAVKLREFAALIRSFRHKAEKSSIADLIEDVLDRSGYRDMLIAGGEEEKERLQYVGELVSRAVEHEAETENATLSTFLEEYALVSDVDAYDEKNDAVVLMTIHSAKGLEFPVVFLPGWEENVFPGDKAAISDEELEEERRLAYVAITRAKERLFCTYAHTRVLYGRTNYGRPSRFLDEIPEEYTVVSPPKVGSPLPSHPVESRPRRKGKDVSLSKEFFRQPAVTGNVGRTTGFERFQTGDRVKHPFFGEGMILSAKEVGADILYEVAFDTAGTKKLMATYAKLTKED